MRLPAWRHRADDFAGKVATLSGWGKTSDEGEYSTGHYPDYHDGPQARAVCRS